MTTQPGETAKQLVKTPGTVTFEEKLEKAQEKQREASEKVVENLSQSVTMKGK